MQNSKGQQVGYIRVSSIGQNTDRQLDGIELDESFIEKQSGKSAADRPQLQACLIHIRKGDVLHVHSIDRLARNLSDLKDLVTKITAKGVAVRFHKENLIFNGGGQSDPMQDLMLNMMGAFAEFERSLISERRNEGIKKALAKGVKFGRTPKITPALAIEIREKKVNGAKVTDLMVEYKVGRQTIYDAIKPPKSKPRKIQI